MEGVLFNWLARFVNLWFEIEWQSVCFEFNVIVISAECRFEWIGMLNGERAFRTSIGTR